MTVSPCEFPPRVFHSPHPEMVAMGYRNTVFRGRVNKNNGKYSK